VGTTQHFIGGFMKYPGDPPDVYHSYLGLAALGVLEHPDIRPVDPVASFSQSAVEYLDQSIRPKYQWTVIDA
jgi:geranylgeranyl transferase type-1 subunit beta